MPRSVDCGGGVVRRYEARKFGFVVRTTIEGRIGGHFLFSNDGHLDVRSTLLISDTWSSTEDGRFAEGKLKPAQEDGVEVVGFDGCGDGHPIAGTIARLTTLDGEGDAILNKIAGLRLGVDGPCRVEFVLVDDDLRGRRNDGGFVASEEPSGNPG